MKIRRTVLAVLAMTALFAGSALAVEFPTKFDYLGPEFKKFTNSQGREMFYIDEGEKDWTPVVFFGGWGTSLQAFYLTEFNHSLRENLKIRVISLGRNGFGMTTFVEKEGYAEYIASLKELLDMLKIDKFATISISGGGSFNGWAIDAMPERITSAHFAASATFWDPDSETMPKICATLKDDLAGYAKKIGEWTKNPMVWWDLGGNLSVHKIPAWQDTANNEGAHAYFIRGQMGDPTPAVHERALYCRPGPTNTSKFNGPVFMYYGTADKSTPVSNIDIWKKYFTKNPMTIYIYDNEGHDAQYRHWEQVLLDVSGQAPGQAVICQGGKTSLVKKDQAGSLVKDGKAIYGSCVWQ